ncbi:unnamed protein product [Anisakis simplex]|uniref:Uncharacterized protein n=1 Tax=Anisakis simplex TaxID=6269 RepID=A0A0M3JSS0_ANISI|nr:unnamed protein product [Anisakis simplex]
MALKQSLRVCTGGEVIASKRNTSKTPPSPAEAYAYKIRPPCAEGNSPPACVRVQKVANGRAPHRRLIDSAQCAHNGAHIDQFIESLHEKVTKFPHSYLHPNSTHKQPCIANGRALSSACAPANGTCMFSVSTAGSNNKGASETSPSSAASSPPLVAIPQPAESSPSKEAVRVRQPLLPVVSASTSPQSPLPPPPPPPRASTTCLTTTHLPTAYRCIPQTEDQALEHEPELFHRHDKFCVLPKPYFAQARLISYASLLILHYYGDSSRKEELFDHVSFEGYFTWRQLMTIIMRMLTHSYSV